MKSHETTRVMHFSAAQSPVECGRCGCTAPITVTNSSYLLPGIRNKGEVWTTFAVQIRCHGETEIWRTQDLPAKSASNQLHEALRGKAFQESMLCYDVTPAVSA